jgi:sugar phosphate isomerase/epimerase
MYIGLPFYIGNINEMNPRILSNLGIDFVEISLNYPWPNKIKNKEVEYFKKLKENGIDIAFHSPRAGVQLFHPSSIISRSAFEEIKKSIKFAKKFEPLYFVLHQNLDVVGFQYLKDEILKNIHNYCRFFNKISKKKFTISFENNDRKFLGSPNQFEFLFSYPNIFLTLDIGHVFISKYEIESSFVPITKEKIDLEVWIKKFKNKIIGIHLHDVIKINGRMYDHIKLGDGKLNLKNIFKELNCTKCQFILIESFYSKERREIKLSERKKEIDYVRKLSKFF